MSLWPQPGTVLADRYRVGSIIGRGGMGLVLEAENTVTQRRVAIKWIDGNLGNSDEAAERLVREARAASRISHPNVVDVYDVMRHGNSVFLVMELLKGEPLSAPYKRGGVPPHELVNLLVQAMHAVAEGHRQQIVHRDIHPGNIFLAREGHDDRIVPKVLDFGISKLGGSPQPALTRSNICMGTPLYMSFEQLCNAKDADHRTDVYSFGVVLYEGLTGVAPFDGESLIDVAAKITAGRPVHPKLLRPDMPTALAEVILWALARNRDERLASMNEFIRELEPFASPRGFRAQMTSPDGAVPISPSHLSVAEAVTVEASAQYRAAAIVRTDLQTAITQLDSRTLDAIGAGMAQVTPASAGHLSKLDTLGRARTPLGYSFIAKAQQRGGWRWAVGGALVTGLVLALASQSRRAEPSPPVEATFSGPQSASSTTGALLTPGTNESSTEPLRAEPPLQEVAVGPSAPIVTPLPTSQEEAVVPTTNPITPKPRTKLGPRRTSALEGPKASPAADGFRAGRPLSSQDLIPDPSEDLSPR